MDIAWLIRVGGIFGSVREAIEVGNALMRLGHTFTMYTDEGRDLGWLPNTLTWRHTRDLIADRHDVLFWSDTPDDPYWEVFQWSQATIKAYCFMGFNPQDALKIQEITGKFISPRHHQLITDGTWILYDGAWQGDHLPVADHGPAIGGINLDQFGPRDVPITADIVWSGDPRPRKGGDLIREALQGSGYTVATYFKKRIPQDQLAAFICSAPIFIDGHHRGGWCNPVMEAMACGSAIVCTDTPCNSDFTRHNENCLLVNNAAEMRAAIDQLMIDPQLRDRLGTAAMATAREHTYDIVAARLHTAITKRVEHARQVVQH